MEESLENLSIGDLSWAQRKELDLSFPRLVKTIMSEMDGATGTSGGLGILGSQKDWTTRENAIKSLKALSVDKKESRTAYYAAREENLGLTHPISPAEEQRQRIKNYLHAIDILEYKPGNDPDAFEEDRKNRQRLNPIAKRSVRGLHAVLESARKRFPEEFRDRKPDMSYDPPPEQKHPTNMLPPANPGLKCELLLELSKIITE